MVNMLTYYSYKKLLKKLCTSYIPLFVADVPDKPGKPEPLETTPNSITLEWEPPLRNGGNPIVGYNVEKRLKGDSKWTKYG